MTHIKNKLFFLLIFLTACTSAQDYSSVTVTKVIDGDTIILSNGQKVRYIGIDTPETRIKQGNRFIYSPQPFALEATERNRQLVKGKGIELEFDIERVDKYNRTLAYCFVDGVHINAKLVEEGYAVTYTIPPNVRYTDELMRLQKDARENKRGMWGAYSDITAAEAENYTNQIRRVKGRVLNAYNSGKVIFLNFGNDYKTDFTVVIFKNSFDQFYNKGIDPVNFYNGKIIGVSGKIRQYNGPEIIVSTPSEIEILSN
ncbi:MAG: hypothetical protein GY858_05015 [Candidatus Omnitrophica bacterium]|nr:hypothetical protein [Candidatus Omnitrophota bacterium]